MDGLRIDNEQTLVITSEVGLQQAFRFHSNVAPLATNGMEPDELIALIRTSEISMVDVGRLVTDPQVPRAEDNLDRWVVRKVTRIWNNRRRIGGTTVVGALINGWGSCGNGALACYEGLKYGALIFGAIACWWFAREPDSDEGEDRPDMAGRLQARDHIIEVVRNQVMPDFFRERPEPLIYREGADQFAWRHTWVANASCYRVGEFAEDAVGRVMPEGSVQGEVFNVASVPAYGRRIMARVCEAAYYHYVYEAIAEPDFWAGWEGQDEQRIACLKSGLRSAWLSARLDIVDLVEDAATRWPGVELGVLANSEIVVNALEFPDDGIRGIQDLRLLRRR